MSQSPRDAGALWITGAWTKAGISSCVKVQGADKHNDFLFDCGYFSSDTTSSKFVLVSHGHIDHVGACIAHARARGLSGTPACYYVPAEIVEHLADARAAFEKLDNAPIAMKLIGISPGDDFNIGSNLRVRAFETTHRVPSQGYAVYMKRKGQLLPELKNLTGDEIKELKLMGQTILSPETEELEMVYTGDTTMEGLIENADNAFIFNARTFIMELTYLDGERSKAQEWGHIHIADVIENAHLFERIEQLVFVHISQKYSLSRILAILRSQLPSELIPKVRVSLHSFGAREHLTHLLDKRWDQQQQNTAGWGWTNAPAVGSYASVTAGAPSSASSSSISNDADNSKFEGSGSSSSVKQNVSSNGQYRNQGGGWHRPGSQSPGRYTKERNTNTWRQGMDCENTNRRSGAGGREHRSNGPGGINKFPRADSNGRSGAPWAARPPS